MTLKWTPMWKRKIEEMKPMQQVEFLVSTLETKGDIIPLAKGLEKRYQTFGDFINTKDHEVFKNEKLVDLLLDHLRTDAESSISFLLNIVRIIGRTGLLKISLFIFFSFVFDLFLFLFRFDWTIDHRERSNRCDPPIDENLYS